MDERPQVVIFFDSVPDPRVERTRRHKLVDILLIVLIGTICECKGWDALHAFAEDSDEYLESILELPHGVPSADTIRRVMSALDPASFRNAFIAWAKHLCVSTAGKLVAIDGKTVRGAFAGANGQGALHLVNAWVCENQMVLGQYATDVKSNEITAIPELLALLDVRGAIVSIDAMGCQKDIARCIVEGGADYIFGLKGNQPTLHQEVLAAFDARTCEHLRGDPNAFDESADKGHGRLEVRRVWVVHDVAWLTRSEQWPALRSLILVESERTLRGKTSCERRAYISSVHASASRFAVLVRNHWHVENKLHWILDVTFGEDHARIGRKNGAENLAIVRKIAINLLKNTPDKKPGESLVAKRRRANRRLNHLLAVLRAGISGN
jgi:predicted transposase YbfD/YdcC